MEGTALAKDYKQNRRIKVKNYKIYLSVYIYIHVQYYNNNYITKNTI